jgi:hypothetical protein
LVSSLNKSEGFLEICFHQVSEALSFARTSLAAFFNNSIAGKFAAWNPNIQAL